MCVCVWGVVVLLLALGDRPEPKGPLFSHSFIQSLFRGVSGAGSVIRHREQPADRGLGGGG